MRQCVFAVLIIFLGELSSRAFCDNLNKNGENRDSFYPLEVPDVISSSPNIYSPEESEDRDYDDKKNAYSYPGENLPEGYESDVAYWESIYGTEDVPDFEEPPPIDGDSIFMDLDDLTDSWNDEEEEEAIPVKRDADGMKTEHNIGRSKSKERMKFGNSWQSGNSNYRNMMSDIYFHEPNFPGSPETSSSSFESEEKNIQFHGSGAVSFSNLNQEESTLSSNNVRKSEIRNSGFTGSDDIAERDIETELESAEQFPAALETRSIKSIRVAADSLLNSKRRIMQAKKDLIDGAVGGTKAEVSNAFHKTIEAKKDMIDSVVSATANAGQRKKEFVQSIGGMQSQDRFQSVLDSKQKVIQAKKDLIHVSAVGSKAEVNDAFVKTFDAKKDLIDSVLSNHRAGIVHARKEFGHSTCCASHTAEKSFSSTSRKTNSQTRGPMHVDLQSGLIDPPSKLDGIDLSAKLETIHDTKSSLHSSSSGSSEFAVGGEIKVASSSINSNHKKESKKIHSSSRISNDPESGSMASHHGVDPAVSSHQIHLSKSGNSKTEISSGVTTVHEGKSSAHSSSSGSSNIAFEGEIGVASSLSKNRHTDLQSGLINPPSKLDEINLSAKLETIHDTKSSLHSSLGGSSDVVVEGEIKVASSSINGNHKKESKKIHSSSRMSKDLELGLMTSHHGVDPAVSSHKIHLSKSGNSKTEISSGVTTVHEGKSSAHSSSSGSSNIAFEGEIEVASSLSKNRHTDLQSGLINAPSKLDGIDVSAKLETIHDTKSSLHSSSSGSSEFAVGGEIKVASSSINSNHKKESKKIHSSSRISKDLELGLMASHHGVDPAVSSHKIHLSKSGNSKTEISSGVTKVHEGKSVHSSSSGNSDFAIEGEIGVASSLGKNHHRTKGTLNLSKRIKTGGQTSTDLELGLKIGQSGIDPLERSGEINFAIDSETTNFATDGKLEEGTSAGDSSSSSEEMVDSLSELSEFSNTKDVSKTEQGENAGIKSSISSGITLNTNLDLGDVVVHSDLKTEGAITSGISTQSNTKTSTIVNEKSSLENGNRGCAALKISDIVGTERKDDSQSIHKGCATGQCGITGKLHMDLNTRGEDSFEEQNEPELSENFDSREDDEEILEVNIQSQVSEADISGAEVGHENPEKNLEFVEDIIDSDVNEDEKTIGNVIERTTDVDDHLLIGDEDHQQTETMNRMGNIELDDDDDEEPEVVLEKNEERGISHAEELENVGSKLEHEFKTKTAVVGREYKVKGHSLAIEKTSDSSEKSTSQYQEERNRAVDHQISVDVDDFENESSHEYHGSTYESKFGKYYSDALHQHQVSQDIGQDVAQCKADGTFSNAYCRLINLDVNCSGMTAFMRPECQQLNANLWHPQDSGTPITLWTVKTYLSHGQELAIEMQNRAKWLCGKGIVPKLHTPAMLHLINNFATENTVGINQESEFSLFGTKLLQRRLSSDFDVTPNTFIEFLQHHAFRVIGTGLCQYVRPKRCPVNQFYRSFDGSCNNKKHPTWGQCNTAFARILPARYTDGIHEPPKSVTGIDLPNPRTLSVHCFSRKLISDPKITLALSQLGQILSHDFSMQTIDQTVEGGIQCCTEGRRQLPKNLQHHSCLPIDISADDKFYSKFDFRCMNFVRSMTISREDCTLGPADQLNTVTSYLDASPVYGSNKETCDKLRAFKGGRMSVAVRRGRELLPTMTNRSHFCDVMSPNEVCYLAGDVRVNQNPQLALMQTVLLREHNRIADELAALNPHWDDERVFQETRRIVIALYQHITYTEWLPLVIGKKYCRRHRLTSRREDAMSRDYNPRIKTATINGFTTAAFRLFHSMVEGNLNLCPANREISHTLRLSNHYFRPQIIERSNNLDDLIRGLVSQPMQQSDVNFHPEVTEYLFRSRNEFGMDLEAIDIQRGRDHGLPGYNAYRKICSLPQARDFDDLNGEISQEGIEKLKKFYAHVDDVDLIVGLVMENKTPGSLVGPVARCLIGEQFYRSRIGDRWFYDNADQPHSFTQEQLGEIKKASLARLLCDTGDNIEEIQPRAFKLISRKNPLTSCHALPKINLCPWQELES